MSDPRTETTDKPALKSPRKPGWSHEFFQGKWAHAAGWALPENATPEFKRGWLDRAARVERRVNGN
jgi:hypothetical protein